jgi:hypothetical protein
VGKDRILGSDRTRKKYLAAIALLQPRARSLKDFAGAFRGYFSDAYEYDTAAVAKFLSDDRSRGLLVELGDRYQSLDEFTEPAAEQLLRAFAEEKGVKAGALINGSRVALTGQGVAPSLFAVMAALGKERVVKGGRLEAEGGRRDSLCARAIGRAIVFALLGDDRNRDGNGVRRHAGVCVAGLVAKGSLQKMLARLRRQVGMQNELTGIHAELLPRSKLQGILGSRREVDRRDVETRHLDHRQPRRNQRLLKGCVGVDVQTVGHAKVKIDLGWPLARECYLMRVKELHRRSRIASLIGAAGQRQWLVLYYLPAQRGGSERQARPNMAVRRNTLFASGGQCLLDAGLDFIF